MSMHVCVRFLAHTHLEELRFPESGEPGTGANITPLGNKDRLSEMRLLWRHAVEQQPNPTCVYSQWFPGQWQEPLPFLSRQTHLEEKISAVRIKMMCGAEMFHYRGYFLFVQQISHNVTIQAACVLVCVCTCFKISHIKQEKLLFNQNVSRLILKADLPLSKTSQALGIICRFL